MILARTSIQVSSFVRWHLHPDVPFFHSQQDRRQVQCPGTIWLIAVHQHFETAFQFLLIFSCLWIHKNNWKMKVRRCPSARRTLKLCSVREGGRLRNRKPSSSLGLTFWYFQESRTKTKIVEPKIDPSQRRASQHIQIHFLETRPNDKWKLSVPPKPFQPQCERRKNLLSCLEINVSSLAHFSSGNIRSWISFPKIVRSHNVKSVTGGRTVHLAPFCITS